MWNVPLEDPKRECKLHGDLFKNNSCKLKKTWKLQKPTVTACQNHLTTSKLHSNKGMSSTLERAPTKK